MLTRFLFPAGVFPPKRRSAQRSERPGRPQPADGERGQSVLHGTLSAPEAAEGGRDGQTGAEGHAGLGPGRLVLKKQYFLYQCERISQG